VGLTISKKSIPLFRLCQGVERFILSNSELHHQIVEPGQRRPFDIQPVQQRLKFVLTGKRVKDDV